ncbi:3-hydroxybutyrate dehydrogenase [Janthinobacterium sp. 17J80-10]|uniref:3-hydroxybutyrate dehydrogenase n=1 Tax=Janthinobacterium sp. 17J80-10 TaxID=2497863 RepID=UPI0010058E8A|nr:3-hydroxybutyrate dehydrogenase [Janthinobacterium sp. 17J80-10]QAU32697.1 3-hydroxybutyrate dehydrogenase [Janthinobacterium sp. 17J80-10]
MQRNGLRGKTALVTGSTSGIGMGIAQALAAQGANILLNGLGDDIQIARLRQSIADENEVDVAYHPADMSKMRDIEDMIRYADSDLGSIDILVNNAGIQHVAPLTQFPVAQWDNIIAINLTACFHTTRLVLPSMLSRNWGRIVNISSVHGLVASPNKSAYIAAKHGLLGLSKAVALETATTGVTCNAICPGWVLTPLVQKQVDARAALEGLSDADMKQRMLIEKQPSGEFVTPEQLGGAVVFLCSDAAAQVRGVSLPIDGGCVAQ